MSLRAEKIARQLHRKLAESLSELVSPDERLTIARVNLTDDIRNARIWIQGWEKIGVSRQSIILRQLQLAIASTLQTKFTPRLTIVVDDSMDYVERIEKLLK